MDSYSAEFINDFMYFYFVIISVCRFEAYFVFILTLKSFMYLYFIIISVFLTVSKGRWIPRGIVLSVIYPMILWWKSSHGCHSNLFAASNVSARPGSISQLIPTTQKLPNIPSGFFYQGDSNSDIEFISLSLRDEGIDLSILPQHAHLNFVDCS
jgi:hypothetical protein